MAEMTGRCACGAVRWSSPGPVLWAGHCHCDSCRRATSSAFTSFFGVPRQTLEWQGDLALRLSSEGRVQRGYCPNCGSQMCYLFDAWSDETHLYAATLDNPADFAPQAHYHYAERVPWASVRDDLPKYPGSSETTEPS